MKAKPLVGRPLEAWHETRTSKSKLTLLDQTHPGLRERRELPPPLEPCELREALALARRSSWKPWLAAPKHQHEPGKKWKGNSKRQMKTNILGGCVVVTGSFIWATRERATVAGTSSFLTDQALEHGEVFPTGRETGSELPTMANRDLICSEPPQSFYSGSPWRDGPCRKNLMLQKLRALHASWPKTNERDMRFSSYPYYRSCCNTALLGNGCRNAAGTIAVSPCTTQLRQGCHLNDKVPTSYRTSAHAEENNTPPF